MYSRTTPFLATIRERYLLTGPNSTKKTYHIVLDIRDSNLTFQIGDSIGVLPMNHPELVDQVLEKLQSNGKETIVDPKTHNLYSFRDYLLYKANLKHVSFHKILPVEKTAHPLLHLLEQHQPHPSELVKVLLPLLPRFYSIASSPKIHPGEIHLTVAHVSYDTGGSMEYGVGSHFLCDLAKIGSTQIPIYVQASNHFSLPDPTSSIILIGPGTGIAPFRAFIQERIATQAPGKNWVFFGERNRASDFYYEDFWTQLEHTGHIHLDLAFSRDQAEKIYVQHKILEQKEKVWDWIQQGCYIYVCGDAKKMAKDVEATLKQVMKEAGGLSEEKARESIKELRSTKRYLLDVY